MRPVLVVVCAAALGVSGYALAQSVQPRRSGTQHVSRSVVRRALRQIAGARSSSVGQIRLPQIVRRTGANTVSFTDPTGDSRIAPDIAGVTVANDDAGTITLKAAIPNRSTLGSDDLILILIDSDQNVGTGFGGFDYALGQVQGASVFLVGNGSILAPGSAASYSASMSGGQAVFTINRSDLGNTSGFNFGFGTSGDQGNNVGELAPDTGIWSYPVIIAAGTTTTTTTTTITTTTPTTTTPPPPPPLSLSVSKFVVGKAKSGTGFGVAMIVVREDTGDLLTSGKIACAARVGTKPLRLRTKAGPKIGLSRCGWKLAKTAKGKRLTGMMKVTFQGVSVTRAFSRKVS